MKNIKFLAIALLTGATNIATSSATSYLSNISLPTWSSMKPEVLTQVQKAANQMETEVPKLAASAEKFTGDVNQNLATFNQNFNQNATALKDNVTAFTTNLNQNLEKVTTDVGTLGKGLDHKLDTFTKDITKATRKIENTADEVKWFARLSSTLIVLVILKYFLFPVMQSLNTYVKQIKENRNKKKYTISMDEKFLS